MKLFSVIVTPMGCITDSDRFYIYAETAEEAQVKAVEDCKDKWKWLRAVATAKEVDVKKPCWYCGVPFDATSDGYCTTCLKECGYDREKVDSLYEEEQERRLQEKLAEMEVCSECRCQIDGYTGDCSCE